MTRENKEKFVNAESERREADENVEVLGKGETFEKDTAFEKDAAFENGETISAEKQNSRRKPMFIALAVVGTVLLGALALWLFRGKEGGQPVPAPRTVSFGESNSDAAPQTSGEQVITLSPEQAERAGIKTETVGERLSGEGGGANVAASTGVVEANAYRATPVVSLAGGVVRQISAELGQSVNRGQTVAVVSSEDLSQTESRYLSLLKELETSRQNYEREAKLVRISPVSNSELDEARAKLKIAQAQADENQKLYNRTTKLVAIGAASREELEQATTKLKTAQAETEQARRSFERAAQVAQINPASRASFEQAAVKVRNAESELAAARQRLLLLGLAPQKIDALRSPNQISSELALSAPASGTITSRSINTGEVVEANKELMRVTDLSSVWVIAQIYENDLPRIRAGSGASVTSGAYPDRVFRGRLTYIDPNINRQTRTAQARVELENPGQILKLGMYVNVAFGALGTAENTTPVVPAAAVQNINNRQVVFVADDKRPNVFAVRPVRLAAESSGFYPVTEGITVGEKIVTDGSFLLRAEWLKSNPGGI